MTSMWQKLDKLGYVRVPREQYDLLDLLLWPGVTDDANWIMLIQKKFPYKLLDEVEVDEKRGYIISTHEVPNENYMLLVSSH
ncbi:MAG: hypothetical protein M0P69_18975 [Bacteroidales bacterium]|nr:hypothetical protein [Bacteroidales bacterium]